MRARWTKHLIFPNFNKTFIGGKVPLYGMTRSKEGLGPNERTLTLLRGLAAPVDVAPKDRVPAVRRFLGLVRVVAGNVPGVAVVLGPLNRLTSTSSQWRWGPEEQASWDAAKRLLEGAVARYPFDPNLPLDGHLDGSDLGCGGLWFQVVNGEFRVLLLWSHAWSGTMLDAAPVTKELYALAEHLVQGEGLISLLPQGQRFRSGTDHQPLEGVLKTLFKYGSDTASARLHGLPLLVLRRMLTFVGEHPDLDLYYVPGKDNQADVLTRPPFLLAPSSKHTGVPVPTRTPKTGRSVRLAALPPSAETKAKSGEEGSASQGTDFGRLLLETRSSVDPMEFSDDVFELGAIELLSNRPWPSRFEDDVFLETRKEVESLLKPPAQLELRNGRLFKRTKPSGPYIRMPQRDEMLFQAHSSATGGHLAFPASLARLEGVGWWESMEKQLANLIFLCGPCQQYNVRKTIPAELRPLPVVSIGERVHIDLVPMGLAGDGSTILIQALDAATGFIQSGALPTKEGRVCARWLWDNWVRVFGLALRLVTDQGTEFVNQFNNAINEFTGMLHETTAPYHPAANGKIERAHGTYMPMLRKTTGATDMPRWPLALAATDMAFNTRVPRTTKVSPYFLMFGRRPFMPLHVVAGIQPNVPASMADWLGVLYRAREAAAASEGLARGLTPMDMRGIGEPKAPSLAVGDLVLVKFPNAKRAMVPRQQGPFQVTQVLREGVSAMLTNVRNSRDTVEHNINVLIPWHGDLESVGKYEWEIDAILGEKRGRGRWGKPQYLVHFRGYSREYDLWLPQKDVDAPVLVEQWNQLSADEKARRLSDYEVQSKELSRNTAQAVQELVEVERVIEKRSGNNEDIYLVAPIGCGPLDYVWVTTGEVLNPGKLVD